MTTPSIRTKLAALTAAAMLLAAPTTHAQARYIYSTAGDEVTDTQTGLTWRRCSEGQTWSGTTCTGTAAAYYHEGALAQAKTQTGWRLPNVKELASIADKARTAPAIDTTAFPATPSHWYWSSTPYAGGASNAWLVSFYDGYASYDYRGSGYLILVRLVR